MWKRCDTRYGLVGERSKRGSVGLLELPTTYLRAARRQSPGARPTDCWQKSRNPWRTEPWARGSPRHCSTTHRTWSRLVRLIQQRNANKTLASACVQRVPPYLPISDSKQRTLTQSSAPSAAFETVRNFNNRFQFFLFRLLCASILHFFYLSKAHIPH